jgi:branched-chain amino acid aminotransferase
MPKQQFIWVDGKFVKFEDAKVHLLTHSLHYGSGIFEGIRCYDTDNGPAIFRLGDHARRFLNSARIYGMPIKISQPAFEGAIKATISKNNLRSAYIRPLGYYNNIGIGFNVKGKTASIAIAAIQFGSLFPEHEKGLRCKVSSWHRISSTTLPPEAKACGNYLNSILGSQEATNSGYDETIFLTGDGHVAEGPGENIFLVQDNVLLTPPKSSSILLGITRDSIIKIAESSGIEVQERDISREELYTSDEAFFAGTAAEITPIVSVDSRILGNAKPGPITKVLADRYSNIVSGKDKEFIHWLSFVSKK